MALLQRNRFGIVSAIYVTRAEWDSLKQYVGSSMQFDPIAARFNGVPVYLTPEEIVNLPEPAKVVPWWLQTIKLVQRFFRAVWF